jgi:hypothetical protein
MLVKGCVRALHEAAGGVTGDIVYVFTIVAVAIADVITADAQTAYRLAAIAESSVDRQIKLDGIVRRWATASAPGAVRRSTRSPDEAHARCPPAPQTPPPA